MAFNNKKFLSNTPESPGIYKMLNQKNNIIYIGKAKNLKKRLSQYFSKQPKDSKTTKLVSLINNIEITITHNETESLILEQTLIKQHRPKYNILLTDDKSYIYLKINFGQNKKFPSIKPFRGKKTASNIFYGPYTSVKHMQSALSIIQKTFKIKNCSETFFNNRVRPCLQYQIKRCSAPCTNYITSDAYLDSVHSAELLLKGKTSTLLKDLEKHMNLASDALNYEDAIKYREQINAITKITQTQTIESSKNTTLNLDIIAIQSSNINNLACIYITNIRDGIVSDSYPIIMKIPNNLDLEISTTDELNQYILELFFSQNYLMNYSPNNANTIISNPTPTKQQLEIYNNILKQKNAKPIHWITKPKHDNKIRIQNATKNAVYQLNNAPLKNPVINIYKPSLFNEISKLISVKSNQLINKIACFDISHHQGAQTVASCVIFNKNGPIKDEYRIFNIKNSIAGDDYGAMREVISRYLKKNLSPKDPLLLIVDGGKGQLSQATSIISKLNCTNIYTLGIAKGPKRKAGLEKIFLPNSSFATTLPHDSELLHLLQFIRDEAHRFAIKHHRTKKTKTVNHSYLVNIAGVGEKKAQALLHHFASLDNIKQANIQDITKINGFTENLAKQIIDFLNKNK